MSSPVARVHKEYQEFVKEQLTLRGIDGPVIFRDIFVKLFHLDLSPVSLILKDHYPHQDAPARNPQPLPNGVGSEHDHKGIIQRLVDRAIRENIRQRANRSPSRKADYLLQKIFKECFVGSSAKLELIDLENLSIAGDGTKLSTFASRYGKKMCSCKKPLSYPPPLL